MRPHIRISASRLKTLQHCSLRFYYESIVKVPSPQHHKTSQGSCIHRLFELLMHPKRRPRFMLLLGLAGELEASSSLLRYIRIYDHYHGIAPYEMDAMVDMLRVAFLGIRSYFMDGDHYRAPPRFFNEYRFQFQLGDATISGVIDLLILWEDRAIVIDLKSQGAKFKRADLPELPQAIMYQLAVQREFNLIPTVEFIMLRHPPTERNPELHIQRVAPHSSDVLVGLSEHLEHMYQVVNDFTLEEALTNPCDDEGFCQRVCPYLRAFEYNAVVYADDPTQTPLRTYLLDKPCHSLDTGEVLIRFRHGGCAKWGGTI